MGWDANDAILQDRDAAAKVIQEARGKIVPLHPETDPVPGMEVRDAAPTPNAAELNTGQLFDSRIKIVENMKLPHFELLGGLFPRGGVSFFAARSGDCKSWLAEKLVVDMSLGGVVLEGLRYNEPRRTVLYVAGESHWTTFVRRAQSVQWDATQNTLHLYDARELEQKGFPIIFESDESRGYAEKLLDKIKPDIVFFDSFSDFFYVDENKASEMKPIMSWLDDIASKRKIAVVLPHHHNKRKPSERKLDFDQDDMIGSSVMQRYASLILTLRRRTLSDGQEWIFVRCTKSRNRYPLPFAFRIEDEDEFEDDRHRVTMKVQLNPDVGTTKNDKVAELIKASFDVGQWFYKREAIDLAAGTMSARTIEYAIKDMQERGQLIDNGEKTNKLQYARKEIKS